VLARHMLLCWHAVSGLRSHLGGCLRDARGVRVQARQAACTHAHTISMARSSSAPYETTRRICHFATARHRRGTACALANWRLTCVTSLILVRRVRARQAILSRRVLRRLQQAAVATEEAEWSSCRRLLTKQRALLSVVYAAWRMHVAPLRSLRGHAALVAVRVELALCAGVLPPDAIAATLYASTRSVYAGSPHVHAATASADFRTRETHARKSALHLDAPQPIFDDTKVREYIQLQRPDII
jgi:hypothetical protein